MVGPSRSGIDLRARPLTPIWVKASTPLHAVGSSLSNEKRAPSREVRVVDSVAPKCPPIVEITERWATAVPTSVALDAVAQAFSDLGMKVKRSGERVEVRTGSNWRFRVLGNLLSSGKTLPVALDVTAASLSERPGLQAYAFDTFGFRITDQLFFGAKESFEARLEELLTIAAAAAHVADRTSGNI